MTRRDDHVTDAMNGAETVATQARDDARAPEAHQPTDQHRAGGSPANVGASPAAPAAGGALVTACFAAATFLGAFLLFLVQPLVAKYILPWFGGGAAVWTTCVLFFQATLLAGYLYAHLGVKRLGTRGQAALHAAVLLAAAAAALPAIVPAERWKLAGDTANPTGQILLLLAATVGLPCLALAATSPLLHAWYGRMRPGAAVYRLYALSNLGSLLALLAYALAVEPLLSRRTQAALWSAGMAAFAVLCAACAMLAARHARGAGPEADAGEAGSDGADRAPGDRDGDASHDGDDDVRGGPVPTPVPAGAMRPAPPPGLSEIDEPPAGPVPQRPLRRGLELALWLALPACTSALLLATTNALTQDLAPVPFLWVLPLALYLVTFIVAFDRPAWYGRPVFAVLLAAGCAGVVWVLAAHPVPSAKDGIAVFSLALFAGCMTLHGELARLRPPPRRLTGYYLAIAAGGAAGGLLAAVGAPMGLRSYAEFPIALCACCALAFAVPLVAERRAPGVAAAFAVPADVVVLGGVLWALGSAHLRHGRVLARVRDFYGVLTVVEVDTPGGPARRLYHGGITHGQQYVAPARRGEPTAYFRADSGIGRLLGPASPLNRPRRVAVVGLGIGTIAAYAGPGDAYHFFEISPDVERLAREWFTYLADAERRGVAVEVVTGDGRLSLDRRAGPGRYDVIALDAFSGDAVPVHLLTLEAFDVYRRHLAPGGVVAVQVSNRYVDLRPPVVAAARRLGWRHAFVQSAVTGEDVFSSDFLLLSPDPAPVEHVRRAAGLAPEGDVPDVQPWTDDHANVLRALR